MTNEKRNKTVWALFWLYCAVMLWLLFDRDGGIAGLTYWEQVQDNLNLVPFHTIRLFVRVLDAPVYRELAIVNLLGNIVMFIPLGVFLPLLMACLRKWWKIWLTTLGIMLVVELAQLFTLRGSFDVDDLILNLTGAAVGYGVFWLLHRNKKSPA